MHPLLSSKFYSLLSIDGTFPGFSQNSFKQVSSCAGSSGAVHSVSLINVYLDLENPGGSGFWVGEYRRVTGGTERVSLQASGSRCGQFLSQMEGAK